MATSLTSPVVVKVEGLGILEDIKNQFFIAPKGIEKATQHALNHALNAVRAKGVRMAREKYTAKAKVIRARIKIRRVSQLATRGEVFFNGKIGTPAGEFNIRPRQLQKWKGVNPRNRKPVEGILARFLKDGPFSAIRGPHGEKSFLARYGGDLIVWYRRTKNGERGLGLRMLWGPSPIQALSPEEARNSLAEYGLDDFRKQLANQVRQLFRKGVA